MKTLITIFLALTINSAFCQQINGYLRERAEQNLKILAKDQSIANRVKIDDVGIHLSDKNQRRSYSVFWGEMGHFISNVENNDYYEIQRLFANKGTQAIQGYNDIVEYQHYTHYPTDISELSIALDPGHFGGSLEEAHLEGRILRMSAADANTGSDVSIYEADLNYVTALLIKQKLEALGCSNILMTRTHSAGSLGFSFTDWLSSEYDRSIKSAFKKGDISKNYFDELQEASKDLKAPINRNKLFTFYRFLDFRSRIDKVNEFRADVTLSIHYNASDNNRPVNSDRYYKPTKDNYNMVFVPGGFLHNELDKKDAMLDFLRLLVSADIDNAVTLGDAILNAQMVTTGVPAVVVDEEGKLGRVSVATDKTGVYARNLPQLRMIRRTIVYGETLLQDNAAEAAALSKKEIKLTDPETGKAIWASNRTDQVAQGYVNGIVDFLKQNKEKREKFTARK